MLAMSALTQERVSVSVFVDPHDRERLAELARNHDRSISAEIRRAIREHIERDQEEEDR
jgi:predicted transcriptional regulator